MAFRVSKGSASIAQPTITVAEMTVMVWSSIKVRCAAHPQQTQHPRGQRGHVVAAHGAKVPSIAMMTEREIGIESAIETGTLMTEGIMTDDDDDIRRWILETAIIL